MDTKTEGPRALAFVLNEVERMSRETVIIKTGSGKLPAGMVLGQRTEDDDKFEPATAAAADPATGAEKAVAILAYPVDATSADAEAVVVRRLAAVKAPMLVFGATIDNSTKRNAAIAQLAGDYIIAR